MDELETEWILAQTVMVWLLAGLVGGILVACAFLVVRAGWRCLA